MCHNGAISQCQLYLTYIKLFYQKSFNIRFSDKALSLSGDNKYLISYHYCHSYDNKYPVDYLYHCLVIVSVQSFTCIKGMYLLLPLLLLCYGKPGDLCTDRDVKGRGM